MSAIDPGCAKTRAFNLLVESSLNLVNLKTKNARDGYPRKAIEKPVLRFLGSRTFSHGLDPFRTLGDARHWYNVGDRDPHWESTVRGW
jgi:hypothetical protein